MKGGARSEFHAHSFLEFYLGLVPGVSASAVDAALKPYHFTVGGDDALPDIANSTKNVFKMKLKLNSFLFQSDRRGFQLQFNLTSILITIGASQRSVLQLT